MSTLPARDRGRSGRLWYDLRNQGLFDASFRSDVLEIDQSLEQMIWRVVSRFAELAQAPLVVSSGVAYGIFDGLFQQALLRQVTDESGDVASACKTARRASWSR